MIYFTKLSSAKILILPEELIEKCPENEDNNAAHFGVDSLEIVVESDTEIFLNGSVKILREVKTPWVAEYFAEQYVRDQWVRSPIQRKFDDLCLFIHSPTELWFRITQSVPNCPFKAGVKMISKIKTQF